MTSAVTPNVTGEVSGPRIATLERNQTLVLGSGALQLQRKSICYLPHSLSLLT